MRHISNLLPLIVRFWSKLSFVGPNSREPYSGRPTSARLTFGALNSEGPYSRWPNSKGLTSEDPNSKGLWLTPSPETHISEKHRRQTTPQTLGAAGNPAPCAAVSG